jgi:hypothetical protein
MSDRSPRTPPRFPRQFFVYVITGTVAAVGIASWLVPATHFWAKVEIIAILVAAIMVAALLPYGLRVFLHTRRALRTLAELPELLRAVRAETWLAFETNALLGGGAEIVVQRLKSEGSDVLFLLNVGVAQGMRPEMMFELVAVPDMEIYGVMRASHVTEEMSWCTLDPGEGKAEFVEQMLTRLDAGEVAPPPGYEVRPFMRDAYQHLWQSLSTTFDPTRRQEATPAEEEDG